MRTQHAAMTIEYEDMTVEIHQRGFDESIYLRIIPKAGGDVYLEESRLNEIRERILSLLSCG